MVGFEDGGCVDVGRVDSGGALCCSSFELVVAFPVLSTVAFWFVGFTGLGGLGGSAAITAGSGVVARFLPNSPDFRSSAAFGTAEDPEGVAGPPSPVVPVEFTVDD